MSVPPTLAYLPELPRRKDWRIGVVGAGFIVADCHLVAYRQAGLNPVAIASRTPARAREVAARHGLPKVHETLAGLLADESLEVLDIGVPPHEQFGVVREAVRYAKRLKGILCQKPLGANYAQARELVRLCEDAGLTLAVNQNMRYDQAVRAAKDLLGRGLLGEPVLATLELRAIPHWMPWQAEQGWCTLRIMSIHHLDTFRFWFGDPARVYASVRPDPRTRFAHSDGICLYILEYENGLRATAWDDVWTGPAREGCAGEIGIRWRIEGLDGLALGTVGWPKYPERAPSTLDYACKAYPGWQRPRWEEVWFPDAFAGPMAELLCALESGRAPASLSGRDNLKTMALVDACYKSAAERRAVELAEIEEGK
ncbi:MAG: Gfo/Idh/MocA family oxidoreductase [Planctomycetota bacterium]|nr:Gfo/Idh/MocA family oxidoreductase [Planctomycetota bacterium]